MKILVQTSAIFLLSFVSGCQPNMTTPSTATSAATTPSIAVSVATAASASKQEVKIEDVRAQMNLKNYGSALEAINEYINRQPANSDAFYLRAKIQSAVGDFSAATISLEQALQAGLSNPSEVLTDAMLVEYRKSTSFKQLQTKYAVLTSRNDKPVVKRPNEDSIVVKAGDITLRLPNN
jgi:tetratricopeptide (TPR) repeat protein